MIERSSDTLFVFPTWKNLPHTPGSRLALAALRLAGWTPLLAPPPGPKFVAAAAPHTANADFWLGLFWMWATRTPLHWVGKHQLFRGPQGAFMRAVGGISLDRSKVRANFVGSVVSIINREEELVLAVAPEGSRAYTPHWRAGFYYMALEAGVPIGVMVLDWGRKQVGISGYVQPSGDIEADFAQIAALLAGVQGRHPENQGPVVPRPSAASETEEAAHGAAEKDLSPRPAQVGSPPSLRPLISSMKRSRLSKSR